MLGIVNDKKYFRDSTAWDRRILHQCVRPWSKRHQKKNLVHLALCCGGPVVLGTEIHCSNK